MCANKENLITCKVCKAIYDKTIQWVRGYCDSKSTSDDFTPISKVKLGNCPICNTQNR